MSINKNVDQKDDTIKHFGDDHSKVALMEQYPSENKNEAPNTPSPISKTTRFNTEMSTEVDTTSFVTEAVTQPITTEIEYDVSTDEEEMLRKFIIYMTLNVMFLTRSHISYHNLSCNNLDNNVLRWWLLLNSNTPRLYSQWLNSVIYFCNKSLGESATLSGSVPTSCWHFAGVSLRVHDVRWCNVAKT